MRRETEKETKKVELLPCPKPKPARKIYLLPVIGGTRIQPKPTLAQLDGEFEC